MEKSLKKNTTSLFWIKKGFTNVVKE